MQKRILFLFSIILLLAPSISIAQTFVLSGAEYLESEGWEPYGLEGMDINKLTLAGEYLYAVAGAAGLWRRNVTQPVSGWEYLGFSDTASIRGPVEDVAAQHGQPPALYVALSPGDTSSPCIARSYDAGITWEGADGGIISADRGFVHSIAPSLTFADTIFAVVRMKIYRSTNRTLSWHLIHEPSMNAIYKVMVIPSIQPHWEMVWLDHETPIFLHQGLVSEDYGETWATVWPTTTTNWSLTSIQRVAMLPILYAGAGRFWKSTNNGVSWFISLARGFGYAGILIDPGNPNHIITGGAMSYFNKTNLYETFDGGSTWDTLRTFPDSMGISALIWDTERGYIYGGSRFFWSPSVPPGTGGIYRWQLSPTRVDDPSPKIPSTFGLMQNYPNPFNHQTTIQYQLSKDAFVALKVYDLLGREVRILVNDYQKAGYYTISFDALMLASGVYFYRMVAGAFVAVRKLMIIL